MTSIPSNISRVPNLLASQIAYANINRSNLSLLTLQAQMATGRAVNKPSDNAVAASAISVLDDRLERSDQRLRNLSAADNLLSLLDTSVGDASDLVLQAKNIASGQIGSGSDATTRRTEAVVIDSLIQQLYGLANRESDGVYVFGGSTPSSPPVQQLHGGYRYTARGSGLLTDIGAQESIPVTLGGNNMIGQTSARQQAGRDLDPALTGSALITDLHGARGTGITLGPISFSFNGGPTATVDLTGADTAQDVVNKLTSAIHTYETANGVTILGPGGISFAGGSLTIDVVSGAPGPNPPLTFSDIGSGVTAQDLGLTAAPFTSTAPLGADLNPKLTNLTPLSALSGLTLPLGSINIRFSGASTSSLTTVDLSSAQSVGDVINLIQTAVPGVRVQVNSAGTGLDILSEVSGPRMSVEGIPGGPPPPADTATQLGIRTFTASTAISDLNNGHGVRIVDGATDPTTGLPDPQGNVDFTIHLGNGNAFPVDLRPQDLVDVQSVINRINAAAAAAVTAGQIPAGSFSAGLSPTTNGIAFHDLQGLGPILVTKENNSAAAEDLGLLNGAFDPASATFIAQDRSGVRVNNLFSALIDLRDSLLANDSNGITVAAGDLDTGVDSLASTRALVGVYANRVQDTTTRQEDQKVLDQKAKSELQDLDFADASIRFNLLQTQLQAGLQTASRALSRTLLDFLG